MFSTDDYDENILWDAMQKKAKLLAPVCPVIKADISKEKQVICLHSNTKPGEVVAISCPCPKCTPMCML